MTFTRHNPPYMSDKQINAFVDGVETPHSVTVLKTRIMPDGNGKMCLEPGLFLCRIHNDHHFLTRANIKQKFEQKKGVISPWQMFKVGDKLSVVEPYIQLTVGSIAPDTTVSIEVSGHKDSYKNTATTPEIAAQGLAGFFGSSPILSQHVWAIAEETKVYLFATDGITIHTVSVTGGSVTPVPADGKMIADQPVGEIASFSTSTPGEITLSAEPTITLPVGAHIGVPVNDILGYCHYSTDWSNRDSYIIAPIATATGTYEKALPYCDGDIKRRLDLRIREKF